MKRVGIVSCDKWSSKIKEDLMLQDSLFKIGIRSEIISWEDKTVDYSKFDCLVLRSVWGYQNNYPEFKKWLELINHLNLPLYNSTDIVLNNIRKDIQFDILCRNNIPCIKTTFIYNEIDAVRNIMVRGDKVLKPIISGSGEKTILCRDQELKTVSDILTIYDSNFNEDDNGLMIQPYVGGIINGEYSCVFVDGINIHNMLRFPGIFASKKKPVFLKDIPSDVKELAHKVSRIDAFNGYLYMRVDIVVENNKPLIMEVELAEPDLMFKYIDNEKVRENGLMLFSDGIARRIR